MHLQMGKYRRYCLNRITFLRGMAVCILLAISVSGCRDSVLEHEDNTSQTITAQQIQDQMRPQNWLGKYQTIQPELIINEINTLRASAGLSVLERDEEADRWAEVRAAEIIFDFSHDRPDGGDMITAYNGEVPKSYGQGIARGHEDAEGLVYEWLELPWQEDNIYGITYTHIGCAVLENNDRLYWVVVYLEETKS